jgi:Na+-transporting methylmalonyl-CoA/oxaloacetate decarboxylase gamma subunit
MLLEQTGPTLLGQVVPMLRDQSGAGSGSLANGLVVALVGLMIVFSALIFISLFIAALPHLLNKLAVIWPEVDEPVTHHAHHESQVADDNAVLAAIGFVLHTEFQRQLDSQHSSEQSS